MAKEIELPPKVTEASREAVHAARDAAQAIETARAVQATVLHESTTASLTEALREVFGEYTEQQRFIDLKRVPLICKQIEYIHENIAEIKTMMDNVKSDLTKKDTDNSTKYVNQDQFWPVKTLVYGVVGIMLTGIVTALLALVLIAAK